MTLLEELAAIGVEVTAQGDNLVIRPASKMPVELKARLRAHKAEVIAVLRERGIVSCSSELGREGSWPSEFQAAVRRFHGQPHARLFRYIGRKVRTPEGPGSLIQVFAERATVLLDSDLAACSVFRPEEIEPLNHDE